MRVSSRIAIVRVPSSVLLANARWEQVLAPDGRSLDWMCVDAHAILEQRRIDFRLEQLDGQGGWRSVGATSGLVSGGVARGLCAVPYAGNAVLRFRAIISS